VAGGVSPYIGEAHRSRLHPSKVACPGSYRPEGLFGREPSPSCGTFAHNSSSAATVAARFLRNVLAQVPRGSRDVTTAAGDESLILVAAYSDSVEAKPKRLDDRECLTPMALPSSS
jgi:hypothetical protein